MQRIITVTSPAATTMLTTLSNVKSELGISGSGSDSLLTRYINSASSLISGYLDRTLGRQSYSEEIRITGSLVPDELFLTNFPLTAIASVTEDGTALAGSDYLANNRKGSLLRLSSSAPILWTANKIVVSYTAGYLLPNDANANLPAEIEEACIALVVNRFRAKGRESGIRSMSGEGIGSVSFLDPTDGTSGLPSAVSASIDHHKVRAL